MPTPASSTATADSPARRSSVASTSSATSSIPLAATTAQNPAAMISTGRDEVMYPSPARACPNSDSGGPVRSAAGDSAGSRASSTADTTNEAASTSSTPGTP